MEVLCDKCGYLFSRDVVINGEVIEEYQNVYGTHCPKCGFFIKPVRKPAFVEAIEEKNELLKMQVLQRLREKLASEKNDGDNREKQAP
jgi:hypothetical protein